MKLEKVLPWLLVLLIVGIVVIALMAVIGNSVKVSYSHVVNQQIDSPGVEARSFAEARNIDMDTQLKQDGRVGATVNVIGGEWLPVALPWCLGILVLLALVVLLVYVLPKRKAG